jgi:hypothetical protein
MLLTLFASYCDESLSLSGLWGVGMVLKHQRFNVALIFLSKPHAEGSRHPENPKRVSVVHLAAFQ